MCYSRPLNMKLQSEEALGIGIYWQLIDDQIVIHRGAYGGVVEF